MTVLPKAGLHARLDAVAALARERPIPWDETRGERIARRISRRVRSPLGTGFRGFAWVGVAGLAVLALYLPAAQALLRGASEQSPVSTHPRSEYIAQDSIDPEPSPPLGDGGLEASTE